MDTVITAECMEAMVEEISYFVIRHVLRKNRVFIEGVSPKKSTLKFRVNLLSLGVFDYADDESDG